MRGEEIKKILSEKEKYFNVELKNGTALKKIRLDYLSDNLALFVTKKGEFKVINTREIRNVEKA